MKTTLLLSAFTLCLATGCGDKSSTGSTQETNASSSPLTAPVDYLGAVGKAQQAAIKGVDVASITHAIQLFQTEHGRYPKDLNELVKEGDLGKIPEAPYGTKLVYDPNTGTVKVVKQ